MMQAEALFVRTFLAPRVNVPKIDIHHPSHNLAAFKQEQVSRCTTMSPQDHPTSTAERKTACYRPKVMSMNTLGVHRGAKSGMDLLHLENPTSPRPTAPAPQPLLSRSGAGPCSLRPGGAVQGQVLLEGQPWHPSKRDFGESEV